MTGQARRARARQGEEAPMNVTLGVNELDGLDKLTHVEARLRLTQNFAIDKEVHEIAT